ncbi:MAG: DEAD/DEAH box helicase [Candidatus Diapherotrites archaeon]|nr:DEAD/DEAH box helicase [Candidatus Diapherotrites archaeon]
MQKIEKIVLEGNGFSSFNEMQKKALGEGLFDKSTVVSAPTASGKTIIMELVALHSILVEKKKVVYTCPLRALASEHFRDFRRKYSKKHGIRAALSIGDFDSSSSYLSGYDIVFSTQEKLDSLLRHRAEWLSQVGLLVVDEIHELDSDRGPTLEMAVTKMRFVSPNLKIIALSATIPNAREISKWLSAQLVESTFRPVELVEGVYFNGIFEYGKGKEKIPFKKDALESVVEDTLGKQKQALVFAMTRKQSEATARKTAVFTQKLLSEKEKTDLAKGAAKIKRVLEQPTSQCMELASLVEKGACFHHAGLLQKQREIIEDLFRDGLLKVTCSTTTLGAGINLPAFRVVIPSLYRYTEYGMERIPVREYKQLSGRAGRPKYNENGESMLFARSEIEADELLQGYVNGEIEEVSSKLGIEPILRTHLLGIIATGYAFDLASLEQFFSRTFYFTQFGNDASFYRKVTGLLGELVEMGFVEANAKKFSATPIGRRVSELYLDPVSAHSMIVFLKKKRFDELAYLYSFVNTSEMSPFFSIPKKLEAGVWAELEEKKGLLGVDVDREMFMDTNLLKKFNTCMVFGEWVNEAPEEKISEDYGIQPGIMHAKKQVAEWMAYSEFELSKALGLAEHLAPLSRLRKRIRHGIKDELLQLVELRGIGRVRARRLFRAGVKTLGDVKKTDVQDLAKIIPPIVAQKVKEQLRQN